MPRTGSEAAELLQRADPHARARAALAISKGESDPELGTILEDRVFDPDPEVRVLAATLLPAFTTTASPDLLFSALEDPCPDVVVAAAEGIATLRPPRAADALTECLASRPGLAGPLALAMAKLGDSGVEELLLDWIDQEDPAVRIGILRALGASGTARSVPAILRFLADAEAGLQVEILAALARIRERVPNAVDQNQLPEGIGGWIATLLASLDRTSILTGISLLAWLRPADGPKHLMALLEAPDRAVRERAREVFGAIAAGDEGAVLEAIAALADRHPEAAAIALDRVAAAREAASRAIVIRMLQHDSPRIRERAAVLAGRSGGIDLARALVGLLEDGVGHVRARAAEALGHLRADPAGPAIEALLRDPFPDVREAALGALRALGSYDVDATRVLEQAGSPEARAAALRACDLRRAPEALLLAVSDPEPEVRMAAAISLFERGVWTEEASVLLADEDPRVRAHALGARLGAVPALPLEPLRAFLHDPDPGVRQALALGLDEVAAVERAEWLRRLLRDPSVAVGRAAASGLARHHDSQTLGALLDAVSTGGVPVALAAIESLGALGDPDALPRLRAVARGGEPALRDTASMAARRIEESSP